MRKANIYIIRNTVNDKVYIGQTIQSVEERFKQHTKPSTFKKRGTYKIYNAMEKYGKENFYIELLESGINLEIVNKKEIEYIEKYNSFKGGYNSNAGGDSKTIHKIKDLNLLKKMFEENKTIVDMAKIFGVSKITIKRTLDSINLKSSDRWVKIDKDFILDNFEKTNTWMAEKLGVSSVSITRACKRYGIKRGKGCNNHLLPQNNKQKLFKED